MSVFISWSGKDTASYRVAVLLKEFIPKVIQRTDCFLSTDTQAGTPWADNIFKELQSRNIGLVCVTRENLTSPWLNFEAGAIAKNVGVARMCPVLVNLPASDVPPPLSSFQMKSLKKEDVLSICKMVNSEKGDQELTREALEDAFEARWEEFEKGLAEALKDLPAPKQAQRTDRELLEEILDKVRGLGSDSVGHDLRQEIQWDRLEKWMKSTIAMPSPNTRVREAGGSTSAS
jgi:hypothetical protein